jgi:hypothetical protein
VEKRGERKENEKEKRKRRTQQFRTKKGEKKKKIGCPFIQRRWPLPSTLDGAD